MRFEERDLLQDLLVLAATEVDEDVVVSVYGGRDNVCGTVRFTFGDRSQRSRSLRLLRHWAEQDVAVALLSHGDELSLFSEPALFARALGDAA